MDLTLTKNLNVKGKADKKRDERGAPPRMCKPAQIRAVCPIPIFIFLQQTHHFFFSFLFTNIRHASNPFSLCMRCGAARQLPTAIVLFYAVYFIHRTCSRVDSVCATLRLDCLCEPWVYNNYNNSFVFVTAPWRMLRSNVLFTLFASRHITTSFPVSSDKN